MSDSKFQVTAVLSESFSVFFGDFPAVVLLSVIIFLPLTVLGIALPDINISGIGNAILSAILTAAITCRVGNRMKGENQSLFTGLSQAMSAGDSKYVIVALLASLGTTLGTVALIIPGLFLVTIWWIAVPASVSEGLGVKASFRRSMDLTEGYRWQIFFLVLLCIILLLFVIGIAFFGIEAIAPTFLDSLAGLLVFDFLGSIIADYYAVLVAVSYYQLRTAKEGLAIDEAASVFA